jgi:hypothetical protein
MHDRPILVANNAIWCPTTHLVPKNTTLVPNIAVDDTTLVLDGETLVPGTIWASDGTILCVTMAKIATLVPKGATCCQTQQFSCPIE